jgi:hypothetical protein
MMVFYYFCLMIERIRIRIYTTDVWVRIQYAQKHVDPVDPDQDSDPDPHPHYSATLQSKILGANRYIDLS